MQPTVLPDAAALAQHGAALIADQARTSIRARGRFVLAVSGGATPRAMLVKLAEADVAWNHVRVVQVDERFAPRGDAARNLTLLQETLLAYAPLAPEHVYPMPVTAADPVAAAADYARQLEQLAGTSPVIDLVQLGLGADGHTASLTPGDAALDVADADVAVTGLYQGRQRMTLTYPVINRARSILWLIAGATKAPMLRRLCAGDTGIPAGRVSREQAVVLADSAAAQDLEPAT